MPKAPYKPCKHPGCPALTQNGYCAKHPRKVQQPENRPSSTRRGYDYYWYNVVRPHVLREYGIPKEDWPLWDVHHEPEYNPDVNPNHWDYTLTPMLHGKHSANHGWRRTETATLRGGEVR